MTSPITVPVIDITDGWTIDEVKTIADCDEAEACLTFAIGDIQRQLFQDRVAGYKRGPKWRGLAKIALGEKQRAFQAVARKRGQINRAARAEAGEANDRLLINIFRSDFPDQFQAAAAKVNAMRKGA